MAILKSLGIVIGLLVGLMMGHQFLATKVEIHRPLIPMTDGVRLAVDVLLPQPKPKTRLPTILIQTRYWRSFALRFPDSPNTIPPAPRDSLTETLIKSGYAVVIVDVRGTGASEGGWSVPWNSREMEDSRQVMDWIVAQPWSDGQIGATGISYEGTSALLTAVHHHPHLKAILAREIEWNLFDDLIAPGGVKNLAFPKAWGESVAALDQNRYPPLFPSQARFLVKGVHPADGDIEGVRLRDLLKLRKIPDVAADLEKVQAPNDPFGPPGNPAVASLGPSAAIEALRTTPAAMSLWGSWWDSTTANAVLKATENLPQVQAVIGIWNHEGTGVAVPFDEFKENKNQLPDEKQIVAFFDKHLKASSSGVRPSSDPLLPQRRWYTISDKGGFWEESTAGWPRTVSRKLILGTQGQLIWESSASEAPLHFFDQTLDVDFTQSSGTTNRWMTGMLVNLKYSDRTKTGRSLVWRTEPLQRPVKLFGRLKWVCQVNVANSNQEELEAAIHVYVDILNKTGHGDYLTEGILKTRSGRIEIDLLPVSIVIPKETRIRLMVAGADRPTFDKIPVRGSSSLQFEGRSDAPCFLEIPERLE